jgi:hypothetical protein
MGGRRWFIVESKSFEFCLDSPGVQIIERGCKNSVSRVTLGKDGAQWFRKNMVAITSQSIDQGFTRTCREAGKVFVLQKNKNDRGRYVSVTEYGYQKRRGSLVIPEGDEGWGWRGFSIALNDVMGHSQPATNHLTGALTAYFQFG